MNPPPPSSYTGWVNGSQANITFRYLGLFQITVKLPHDPYKIQVMVGVDIENREVLT